MPARSPGSRLPRADVPRTNKETNKNNLAQWIQKAQLEKQISEEVANTQAIKERAQQQQRQIYLLGNQVSEYEGIIHGGETRADVNAAKAKELRKSLTRERKLAQTNEDYTQQVEKRCDELQMINSNLRRSAAEREKTWKRQLAQTEKRVHDLEEALSTSSSGLQTYRQHVLKHVEGWTLLKDALRERNELEHPEKERLGRLMENVLQVISGSETLCQSVMEQLRVRRNGKSGGQPRRPERLSTALEDVKMSGSFDSSDPNHESTMPKPMSICSVISDSPYDGDINMESSDPSTDFAMSDSTDTDSMVLDSQSFNSWDSDSHPRFPSPPGSIRFPSRKRAGYICFPDSSSSSEPEDDRLKFKHIRMVPRSLRQAREGIPNSKEVERAKSSSVTPTQLGTTLASRSINLRVVDAVTVYTVSPTFPKLPLHPPLPPSLSYGTQTEEPPRLENHVAVSVHSDGLDRKSRQTQTNVPEFAPRGVQMGESLAGYIETKKQVVSRPKTQKRTTQAPSVDERVRSLMPCTWPQHTTPEPGDHPSTTMMGTQRHVLANQGKRVRLALTQWALRMVQKHRHDLILGMISLITLLYLWHGHRVHREWMMVNQIPRTVMAELRHRRVGEFRWMESIQYELAQWMDVDRVSLG
ncbi:hypothetical protein N7510_003141 [Penicillium lagena]|uniref:uncharacterized protein n=1 Tax=Penicillium lagena TaxID=94218 RepID=UPI0025419100|nr:uncharacterized protein N7510_003141 [Penicillium lagena]KAJ5619157.1 hypothetical protein N7510_003141 [Penicillium lagena]